MRSRPRRSRGPRTERDARRRSLGQNFLVDDRRIASVVALLDAPRGSVVLDLGAGKGALSARAAHGGLRVVAVERDPEWASRLRDASRTWGDVTVHEGDLMTTAFPREPHYVLSSPPYHRGTELVRRLLSDAHGLVRAVLVLQLETARRLAGTPRCGLFPATWAPWFELRVHDRIPATAFRPVPSVDSAILTLAPRARPLLSPATFAPYQRMLSDVFEGRGVTVAQRLRSHGDRNRIRAALTGAGAPPDATPSQLSPEQYAAVFAATTPAGATTTVGGPARRRGRR